MKTIYEKYLKVLINCVSALELATRDIKQIIIHIDSVNKVFVRGMGNMFI